MNLKKHFVCVALLAWLAHGAHAQGAWPEKPIKLLVGFPAGGSVDQVARLLGQRLGAVLGQPVVVENRAGASGTIATSALALAHSPADGYNFGMVWDTHAVVPSLMKTKSYGSSGSGSLGHLTALRLFDRLKLDLTHVPYKGGAPMIQDTLGQQVDVSIGSVFVMKPFIESGALRPLAVTSTSRSAALPAVPAVSESDAPGFRALSWWGVVAPAGVPKAIAARMHAEILKVLAEPAVARQLTEQGMDVAATSQDEFRSFVVRQMDEWGAVVKTNNVHIE